MPSLLRRRPSPAMVVALLALFVALGGPAMAAHLVDGRLIKKNSITTTQIRKGTLKLSDLSPTTITSLRRTPEASIDAAKLVPGAVGSTAIADKSVGAGDLADGAIGPVQLSAGAVTSSKLADGAVGSGAVADGGLQARDIGDFSGAVQIPFSQFDPSSCQYGPVTPTPVDPAQNANIADDVILVTAPVGWPDQLTVTANPGAGNMLRVIVCNPTTTTIPVPTNVAPVFRYLGIDQP